MPRGWPPCLTSSCTAVVVSILNRAIKPKSDALLASADPGLCVPLSEYIMIRDGRRDSEGGGSGKCRLTLLVRVNVKFAARSPLKAPIDHLLKWIASLTHSSASLGGRRRTRACKMTLRKSIFEPKSDKGCPGCCTERSRLSRSKQPKEEDEAAGKEKRDYFLTAF